MTGRPRWLVAAFATAMTLAAPAMAAFPMAYAPTAVLPGGTPQRFEFDLTAALRRAHNEGKRLYVYLGASDCPFCRKYEAFLAANAGELAPHFAKDYIVIDLRSSLAVQADRLFFRIGTSSAARVRVTVRRNFIAPVAGFPTARARSRRCPCRPASASVVCPGR